MSSQELLSALSEMLDQKLQPIKADIAELKAEMREVKTDIAELKAEMQEVKTDVAELKAEMWEVKTDVAELKAEMREVKTDIAELKTEMQTAKRNIAELKASVELVEIRGRDASLYMENTIEPQLRLLVENYVPSAKKYEKEAAQIGQLWVEVDILKKVVSEHSQKLQMLG